MKYLSCSFTDVKLEESGGSIVLSALDMLEKDTNVTKAQFATYARAIFTLLQAGPASKAEKVFDDCSLSSSRKWANFMICSASCVPLSARTIQRKLTLVAALSTTPLRFPSRRSSSRALRTSSMLFNTSGSTRKCP
jgi:hypothetical protein